MSERQKEERRRTLTCSGNLGLYCWLHSVENTTPEELVSLFHQKAEQVRHYALQIFDDAEEESYVGSMWDNETRKELDEKEYYHEDD